SGLDYQAFRDYMSANAYTAAKRLYSQALRVEEDRVWFGNRMATMRFYLALIESDSSTMQQVLRDNQTGSGIDMELNFVNCVLVVDSAGATSSINQYATRYPQSINFVVDAKAIVACIPWLTALKDTRHADHAKAVDYLRDSRGWLYVTFSLIRKLPTEEIL